jgi:hypothetical protein
MRTTPEDRRLVVEAVAVVPSGARPCGELAAPCRPTCPRAFRGLAFERLCPP